MAGNISMFAGQTGELRLGSDGGVVDNIQFSLEPIPEPSAFALFVLGSLLFLNGFRTNQTNMKRARLP